MDFWLKSTAVVAVLVAAALAAIFGLAGITLEGNYQDIERQQAQRDMDRVLARVDADLARLEGNAVEILQVADVLLAPDEAAPDNSSAIAFNAMFSTNDIALVYFVAPRQDLVGGALFDPASSSFLPLPQRLNTSLQSHPWLSPFERTDSESAVLELDGRWFLVATVELPDAPGLMMIGRHIMPDYVVGLASDVQLEVKLATDASLPSMVGSASLDRQARDAMVIRQTIPSPGENGGLVVEIFDDRSFYAEASSSLSLFFWLSLALALTVLAIGLLVFRITVTGRVRALGNMMSHIAGDGHLGERVDARGSDEVAVLARRFNELLASLETRTAALHDANDSLQDFARVVTHDLKSPLSTFSLNLKMAQATASKAGDEQMLARIDRMARASERMNRRIDTILNYSRSRQEPVALGPVALGEVLDAVLADVAAEVARTEATVEVGELPHVNGNAELLAQLLQNLISNALKFHKENEVPHIHVSSEQQNGCWDIVVSDEGMGFSNEDAERMFSPFARLEAAAKRDGHGVGLATCADLVRRMEGTIRAEGEVGVGARFTIRLNAAP